MNRFIGIGRTTADIELRYTPQTQTAVGTFTLAIPRQKKEDGSDFIRCKVWGKRAEVMSKYVPKGHKVGISGRIETGSYKNRDGVTVYTTEVIVDDFEFLEPKSQTVSQSPQQSFNDLPDGYEQVDDDLPF